MKDRMRTSGLVTPLLFRTGIESAFVWIFPYDWVWSPVILPYNRGYGLSYRMYISECCESGEWNTSPLVASHKLTWRLVDHIHTLLVPALPRRWFPACMCQGRFFPCLKDGMNEKQSIESAGKDRMSNTPLSVIL